MSDGYDDEIVKDLKNAVEVLEESIRKLKQAYVAPDVVVVDRDGDTWRKQADGTYTCDVEPENYYGMSFYALESSFGPLE